MSGLVLTPFTQLPTSELAQDLHALVTSNKERLEPDFPSVVGRFSRPKVASASTQAIVDAMNARAGLYGAYAVRHNNRLIGVAEYEQMVLELTHGVWPFRYRKAAVIGPHLTLWLGTDHHQQLLPAILQQTAYALRKISGLEGRAHALVRPEQRPVVALLADPCNGFGGFVPINHAARWRGDGVRRRRILMAAQLTIAELPIDKRR